LRLRRAAMNTPGQATGGHDGYVDRRQFQIAEAPGDRRQLIAGQLPVRPTIKIRDVEY
jgi:hypothetical protein